jgi:hypothetical protein
MQDRIAIWYFVRPCHWKVYEFEVPSRPHNKAATGSFIKKHNFYLFIAGAAPGYIMGVWDVLNI